MHVLKHLPAESVTQPDPVSGLPVTRLTSAGGHSHALYFTTDSWTGDGRHLLIASERAGANELYAYRMEDGGLLQLTAGGPGAAPGSTHNLTVLDPSGMRLACWQHGRLTILDLRDGSRREIFAVEGRRNHDLSWTADGRWILTCTSDLEATSNGTNTGDRDRWMAAPPMSQVIAIAVDGSGHRVLHQERWLINHVNASPTDPDLFIFSHEGPWLQVAQRIWAMRLSGGTPWKVVPRDPDWGVGHEYWLADGRTVGYHARYREGTWRHAAGFADVVSGEVWQAELSVPTHHAVAQTRELVILDSTREAGEYLLAVPREGDRWGAPRVLARHDASRHHHRAHVHPRLSRDGRWVVFTSDRRSYSDAYLVPVPQDLSALPVWPGKPYRYYWE